MLSCSRGQIDTVKLLVENQKESFKFFEIQHCLESACRLGHNRLVEYLVKDKKSQPTQLCFSEAVGIGSIDTVRFLVENQSPSDELMRFLVEVAAKRDQPHILRYFLSDPKVASIIDFSKLLGHVATSAKKPVPTMRYLIEELKVEPKIDSKTMYEIVASGCSEVIEYLLSLPSFKLPESPSKDMSLFLGAARSNQLMIMYDMLNDPRFQIDENLLYSALDELTKQRFVIPDDLLHHPLVDKISVHKIEDLVKKAYNARIAEPLLARVRWHYEQLLTENEIRIETEKTTEKLERLQTEENLQDGTEGLQENVRDEEPTDLLAEEGDEGANESLLGDEEEDEELRFESEDDDDLRFESETEEEEEPPIKSGLAEDEGIEGPDSIEEQAKELTRDLTKPLFKRWSNEAIEMDDAGSIHALHRMGAEEVKLQRKFIFAVQNESFKSADALFDYVELKDKNSIMSTVSLICVKDQRELAEKILKRTRPYLSKTSLDSLHTRLRRRRLHEVANIVFRYMNMQTETV